MWPLESQQHEDQSQGRAGPHGCDSGWFLSEACSSVAMGVGAGLKSAEHSLHRTWLLGPRALDTKAKGQARRGWGGCTGLQVQVLFKACRASKTWGRFLLSPFFHFSHHLLSACCIPGPALGAGA